MSQLAGAAPENTARRNFAALYISNFLKVHCVKDGMNGPHRSESRQPFDQGFLSPAETLVEGQRVSHRVAYSQWGNPQGLPLLMFHGGPGSGSSTALPSLFDPQIYRVVQFDQRGCGLSQPLGELRSNRTVALLDDAERLRQHLGIEQWWVVGGSWGATLAILYGARYRNRVHGLLLRGLFLAGQSDLEWFFEGAGALHPAAWSCFAAELPAGGLPDRLASLAEIFQTGSPAEQERLAQAWFSWEQLLGGAEAAPPPLPPPQGETLARLINRYRIQSQYLAHGCWLNEGQVLAACTDLAGLPVVLLHGEEDQVCRIRNAEQAQQCLPGSRLHRVPKAGHDPFHPAMVQAMGTALMDLTGN